MDPRWGIAAVSLRSAETIEALRRQDGLYTLAVDRSRAGDAHPRRAFGRARPRRGRAAAAAARRSGGADRHQHGHREGLLPGRRRYARFQPSRRDPRSRAAPPSRRA
ncbi:MAG: hypothetical protein WDN44_09760 [Sphingomonas sp.]